MAKTARVCGKAGCPEIVIGANWCTTHQPAPWTGSTWQATKPTGWAKTRSHILRRDNNTCTYCGEPATEVDHIIPVSRGGTHQLTNLTASCHNCNDAKNHQQRQE